MGFSGCVTGIFRPARNLCFVSYLVTNYIIVFFGHHLRPRFNTGACVDGRLILKLMN